MEYKELKNTAQGLYSIISLHQYKQIRNFEAKCQEKIWKLQELLKEYEENPEPEVTFRQVQYKCPKCKEPIKLNLEWG